MTDFDHAALAAALAGRAGSVTNDAGMPALLTESLRADAGLLTTDGALAVTTGTFTGRAAADKFIVRDAETAGRVWWDNANAISRAQFDALLADFVAAFAGRPLQVQALSAGADPAWRMAVRVITDSPWHALFIRNLLICEAAPADAPQVTVLHLPGFTADPERHGTRTGTVIALDLTRRLALIGGTAYGGEIKKSVFSLFNYHAPLAGVLPMHCSANVGPGGDVALFFGLSGTGKTTLSSDPGRALIGDDEHGWSENGVFNIEGGCYAKTIGLDAEAEPAIHAATQRFGTVLENVVVDEASRRPDFDDASLTQNGRAAYPLEAIASVHPGGRGPQPDNVVLLTADAFGVLPPIARLDADQAVYHFLSGYTAKVAGTERGVDEPQATFSTCFGAPFMPLLPRVYGDLLRERLAGSGARAWLINTGWVGGPYGVGRRIALSATRRLVAAALSGALDAAPTRTDPVFGLAVPEAVDGVPAELLDPRRGWADPAAYDAQARRLRALFEENYALIDDTAAPARRTAAQ